MGKIPAQFLKKKRELKEDSKEESSRVVPAKKLGLHMRHVLFKGTKKRKEGKEWEKRPRKVSLHSENSNQEPVEYDFVELAELEPELKRLLIEKEDRGITLDWKNKYTRYYLCKTILKKDYSISSFNLPRDHGLVPTVPSRRLYVQWIHDLLLSSGDLDG